jgi:hypothetical protein
MPTKKQTEAEEIRQLKRIVKQRGYQIGSMYHVIQQILRDHPHLQPIQPPLEGQTEIESLRSQLSQARGLLRSRSAPVPAAAAADEVDPDANQPKRVKIASYPLHAICSICFNAYDEGEHRANAFQCGHIFCESCLFEQKKTTTTTGRPFSCAKCRRDIVGLIPLFFDA